MFQWQHLTNERLMDQYSTVPLGQYFIIVQFGSYSIVLTQSFVY